MNGNFNDLQWMVVGLSVHLTDTYERMMVAGYLRMPFHPFPHSEYGRNIE